MELAKLWGTLGILQGLCGGIYRDCVGFGVHGQI